MGSSAGSNARKRRAELLARVRREQAEGLKLPEGWPEDDIEPGTKWEDVPEDWICPDCGVGKEDFDMVEIS